MSEGWRTRLTLKPGQAGTKHLVDKYGDRLVCVRYRYDAATRRRYKTVELIVEEAAWDLPGPAYAETDVVSIRIAREEPDLQREVKAAGGRWNADLKMWELRYGAVVELGLQGRIVERK